jgi:hypothetical protein
MSFKDNHKLAELRIDIERDITPGLPAVDRAIEFVRTRSRATSAELHIVMDLPEDDVPSYHLSDALEDGRLVKDGKFWTLGAAAVVELAVEVEVLDAEAA